MNPSIMCTLLLGFLKKPSENMVSNYFVLFQSLFSEELKPAEELRAQIISLPQCLPPPRVLGLSS